MEVTDVSQLMSLIQSGSVSIICNSAELEESSRDIDNSVLRSQGTNSDGHILQQSLGGSLVITEDDEAEKSNTTDVSCVMQDEVEPNEYTELDEAVEVKRLDKYHSDNKPSSPLHLTEKDYFFQINDGRFIQVLGTLEQDDGADTLPEVPSREGISSHVEDNTDDVQILVVGNNSEEDMYLISTPDKSTEEDQLRRLVETEVKGNTILENTEETSVLQSNTSTVMSVIPKKQVEDPININEDDNDNCQENLQDSVHDVNFDSKLQNSIHVRCTKFKSRPHSTPGTDQLPGLHEELQLCSKDLPLSNFPAHKNHQKTLKDKEKLLLKLPSNSLKEGTLVRTDKGDMIAYNLSSLPQLKESTGQKSKLHTIASMFGPVMKVLQPVESKSEAPPKTCREFSVFNWKDSSPVLHSEHSLQNHQPSHHKDLLHECFVCGKKFLNIQCVRSHIQEKHTNKKLHCSSCSYRSESVKDLLEHQKSHKDLELSCHCGKTFVSSKFYRNHMMSCPERRKSQVHESACELSPVSKEILEREENQQTTIDDDEGMRYLKSKKAEDSNLKIDGIPELDDYVSTSYVRRKSSKTSVDLRFVKKDTEFKFESKYYHRQAKRMALEQVKQSVQRPSRAGRERNHRCYLCFKLFSTAAALESHKENYHLAKTERPVRVKTDIALDEVEELDDTNTIQDEIVSSEDTPAEIVIKEEPVELSEDFESICIVVDEFLDSPHVVKPLCIACKTYTNIDFRRNSKWFNQIPDDCQSEMLKKFLQFFPCSFEPDSLEEPWMLCKKCVVVIDKIADMEEKLSSLKNIFLSRVKGKSETPSTIKQSTLIQHILSEGSKLESDTSLIRDNIQDIGKNLSDIEAYMKDTCEIMEITKLQKGPGRPRKHNLKEKLTPVLVEGENGGESVSDIVKLMITNLDKKEQENTVADLVITNKSVEKNEENTSVSKITIQSDVNSDNVKLKQDFVQCKENSNGSTGSESVSWKVIAFTDQNNQFDNLCVGVENNYHKNTQSREITYEMTNETDPQNDSACTESKFESFCENFTSDHLPNEKSNPLNVLDVDACDMSEKLDSGDEYDRYNPVQEGVESFNYVTHERPASINEQSERLPSTIHSNEDEQTNYQKLDMPVLKIMGRKRMQEERKKMCYKVEEVLKKPWRCRECHKSFSTKRGACDHYAASHKGENYTCEHCPVSYVRKRDLIGHYNKMHLNIKPYKCKSSECPEMFSSHGDLYRHMQSVHNTNKGNMKYVCHICGAEFLEKRYRDAHLPVCLSKGSDSAPHKCPLCHKAFKLAKYLQLHMRTVHWLKDQHFLCEICDKILTDKKNVIIHMKSHLGETKAKCEVCGKEFNRKSYLWTHMRTHTNQRPYKCNYCTKAFNQYSTWKNHERTHTGEKPYKCHLCSANFATSSSLSKHVQYGHYNIRDYECDLCKKKFTTKSKVEEHIKIHTGEKPFKCHICNRAFNKKNIMRNHMYVHSANKKYKCEICGEGFMRKSTIENHIVEHHKFEFVISSNSEGKDMDVEVSPSQLISKFISVKGVDDVPPEDSYIIVFPNDDEEQSDPKEMQLTVLAEDAISSQTGIRTGDAAIPSACTGALASVDSNSDVLSGMIRGSDHLTTLIRDDIPPSITIPEESDTTENQVMQIDDSSFTFRIVEVADGTV